MLQVDLIYIIWCNGVCTLSNTLKTDYGGMTIMKTIIQMIGSGHYFEDLRVLQAAIDKKGKLPLDYFERDENFCSETWGANWRSKSELRKIRQELVDEILAIIKAQNRLPYADKMPADHYARYLHALAILKIDKDVLHHTKNDFILNAFWDLWKLDDGSEEIWKTIDSASWFISETIKGLKGERMSEIIAPED